MAAEQSPEERLRQQAHARGAKSSELLWLETLVKHFRALARIYQSEGWEKAEEWLARGRGG